MVGSYEKIDGNLITPYLHMNVLTIATQSNWSKALYEDLISSTAKSIASFLRRSLGGFALSFLFTMAPMLSVSCGVTGVAAYTTLGLTNPETTEGPIKFLQAWLKNVFLDWQDVPPYVTSNSPAVGSFSERLIIRSVGRNLPIVVYETWKAKTCRVSTVLVESRVTNQA